MKAGPSTGLVVSDNSSLVVKTNKLAVTLAFCGIVAKDALHVVRSAVPLFVAVGEVYGLLSLASYIWSFNTTSSPKPLDLLSIVLWFGTLCYVIFALIVSSNLRKDDGDPFSLNIPDKFPYFRDKYVVPLFALGLMCVIAWIYNKIIVRAVDYCQQCLVEAKKQAQLEKRR